MKFPGLFRNKHKYILVDKFQYINTLQVDLLKMLLTDKNQLFCVGDDWQSIYGFRGSNVDYIVNFRQHLSDAEILKLNLNYRSTEHTAGASNKVIKNNKLRIDKDIRSSKKSDSKIINYVGKDENENIDYVIE